MPGPDLKETAGNLVMLSMFVELAILLIFVWFRQRRENPLPSRHIWSCIALIFTFGIMGAILAPILVAAQR